MYAADVNNVQDKIHCYIIVYWLVPELDKIQSAKELLCVKYGLLS